MQRVIQIKEEMRQLNNLLEQLKEELISLQSNCKHEFISNGYIQACTKCQTVESLNW
ncbi:hypothetical protein [Ectobacillus funiculus]|uniref:Serine protease n=1 Tax=Ectobacillus funiculus TaxID=137993 RepID=A0ABV5WFD1_9BACI